VADRVPASSASSSTAPRIASFNYPDAKPFVDPVGQDFFNSLLEGHSVLVRHGTQDYFPKTLGS
jgi:hypothetical protein